MSGINLLKRDRLLAITGPTSAGKSYMIQNHIFKLCKERTQFRALYIVPTRALISEVSGELRNRLQKEDVPIRVSVGNAEELSDRSILVLTPERCLQLLRKKENSQKIDFIFVDEIQKVEDAERGVILEYVLQELLRLQSTAQIVLAGPYLKKLESTMIQLCGFAGQPVESIFSPVYQLKTIFTLSKAQPNKVRITLKTDKDCFVSTNIITKKPYIMK